jgi:transcriptional regulator with XRE-family HTH domain
MLIMQQDGLPQALRAYMREANLTQIEIAVGADISQATVSRLLKREPARRTRAYLRLFTYMQQAGRIAPPPVAGEQLVLAAFLGIWDESAEHANAVARIIKATEDLRPVRKESA